MLLQFPLQHSCLGFQKSGQFMFWKIGDFFLFLTDLLEIAMQI